MFIVLLLQKIHRCTSGQWLTLSEHSKKVSILNFGQGPSVWSSSILSAPPWASFHQAKTCSWVSSTWLWEEACRVVYHWSPDCMLYGGNIQSGDQSRWTSPINDQDSLQRRAETSFTTSKWCNLAHGKHFHSVITFSTVCVHVSLKTESMCSHMEHWDSWAYLQQKSCP